MSLMLDSIVFEVNTDQLADAYSKVGMLADAVDRLNAPLTELTAKSAKVTKKIKEQKEVTSEAVTEVENLGNQSEKAGGKVDRITNIINKQIESMKILRNESVDVADGVEKFGEGFTKSQAGQLANIKLLGATTEQMKLLADSFKQFNDISGVNPFDKSASGLFKMSKELQELEVVSKLSSEGLNLTKNQVTELSRDLVRLTQALKSVGASEEEIISESQRLKKEFVEKAALVNVYIEKSKEAERVAKEKAKAESDAESLSMNMWRLRVDEEVKGREILRKNFRDYYEELDKLEKQRIETEQKGFISYSRLQMLKKQEAEDTSKAILAEMKKMYLADEKAANPTTGRSAADKSTRELAAANKYLTDTEQRLHEALAETNSDLKLRFSDQLAKIKRNLMIVGEATDETSARFMRLNDMIHKVAAKERANDINNLGRAMSVQLGDVAVSLASGMNPLMVMIQQGDQIRDAISRSRVEGKQLEKAMASAASVIATSFINTGKVVGTFLTGAVRASGEALTGLLVSMKGIEASNAFAKKVKEIHDLEDAGVALNGTLAVTKTIISAIGASTLALITAIVATGVAMYNLAKTGDELGKSLALSGVNMGITKDQAIAMSGAISAATGATLVKAQETLSQIAASSSLTGDAINIAAKSAIELEKVAGVSIESTIAQFEKMKEKPVEALTELAKTTGYVSAAVIQQVQDLEAAGKHQEASALAIKTLGIANENAAKKIRESMSPLGALFLTVKKDVEAFKDSIYDLANSSIIVDTLRNTWNGLAKAIYDVGYTFKRLKVSMDLTMSNSDADKELLKLQYERAKYFGQIVDNQTRLNGLTAQELALQSKAVAIAADARSEYLKNASSETKQLAEKLVLENKISDAKKLYGQLVVKALKAETQESKTALSNEASAMLISINQYNKALDELAKKKKKDPGVAKIENFGESALNAFIQLQDKAIGKADDLTQAQVKYLDLSQRKEWKLLPDSIQQQIVAQMALADAMERTNQEADRQEKFAELMASISGKSIEFTKEYNKQTAMISEAFLKGDFGNPMSKEALDNYTKVLTLLNSVQPAAKANTEAIKKYNDEILKGSDKLDIELQQLGFRNSLIGLSAEDQKLLNIEQQKYVDLMKMDLEYAAKKKEIENDTKITDETARSKLIKDLDEQRIKEISVIAKKYNTEIAEHYRAEYDRVINGISDSIVTALINGGREGGKKLRDLIIEELKKPIVVVVKAMLDGAIGNLFTGNSQSSSGSSSNNSFIDSVNKSISDSYTKVFDKIANSSVGEKLGLSQKVDMGPPTESGQFGMTKEITDMGKMVKDGLGMVSSAMTSYSIQKGISNGYQIGNGKVMDAISSIGGAIASAYFGPIGGAVVGAITGTLNRAFGRKLKDTGIEGSFGGTSGFSGRGYEFYKGGWFRSDKTKYKALDSEFTSGMANTFKQMQVNTALYAESIGLTSDAVANYTKTIKVSMKGLTEEQAQKKLEEELNLIQEEMSKLALGTSFVKKTTETYSEALQRLSTNLSGVNGLFDNLNYKLLDVSMSSAELASSLVDAFGSLDNMTTKVQSYYDNYYTTAEKNAIVTRQVTTALTKLGYSMPKTRDEFRALVESQDLTTEAGRNAYASLISLSDAFASLTVSTDDMIQSLKDAISTTKDAANSQIDGAVSYLNSVIETSKDTEKTWSNLSKDIKTYLDQLSSSIGAESAVQKRAAAKNQFDTVVKEIRSGNTENANSLTDLSNSYLSAVADTSATSEEYVRAVSGVRAELESLVGYSDTQAILEKVKQELAQKTIDVLTNLQNYLNTDAVTVEGIQGFINQLKDMESAQSDFEKVRQELAQKNIDSIDSLQAYMTASTSSITSLQAYLNAGAVSNASLQAYLTSNAVTKENLQSFVDQLSEIKDTIDLSKILGDETLLEKWIKPLETSLTTLTSELIKLKEEGLKTVVDTVVTIVNSQVNPSKPTQPVPQEVTEADKLKQQQQDIAKYWQAYREAASKGGDSVDFPEWSDYVKDSYASGGFHMGGLRLVGENGPEIEATGSARIWTANQTQLMLSDNNSGISEELLKQVIEELQVSRENMRIAMFQIAKNTQKTSEQLNRWNGDGMPETRT